MRTYLFITSNESDDWGGSELLWSSTAEKLARRGEKVRVSVREFGKPIPVVERVRAAGCRIFYRRVRRRLLYRAARKLFPLPEDSRTHMRSAGTGVDLVVISQGGNKEGLLWMEEARAAGHRYVVIAEGASQLLWQDDQTAERLAQSYEGAVRSYFVSQANLDLTRRQFATPLYGSRVIRNPFNVRYDARPPWPAHHMEVLSLACVGRLDAGTKGQDLLLEVLSLPHWRERKVHVSVVGGGINSRLLRHMAEELKLSSIDFAGHIEDMEAVWTKHHALILPSRLEGMPLVVVEAMLCGRPCIATDVGGNRELIRDGVNGFLAKAPTVELLDEAMNRAWDNRHRLREMGERAANDVRQWVSADPVEDFVRDLTAIVEGMNQVKPDQ